MTNFKLDKVSTLNIFKHFSALSQSVPLTYRSPPSVIFKVLCWASFALTFVFYLTEALQSQLIRCLHAAGPHLSLHTQRHTHTHRQVGISKDSMIPIRFSVSFFEWCFVFWGYTHTHTHTHTSIHPCGGGLFEEGTELVLQDSLVGRVFLQLCCRVCVCVCVCVCIDGHVSACKISGTKQEATHVHTCTHTKTYTYLSQCVC